MARTTRVAVVGGGLGGLTAALALIARGFDVTVYEQAHELGEIGAGVQLAPNAMKVLMALGLEKQVLSAAFEPDAHVVRNWKTGSITATTQMKGVYHQQFNAGYYTFHRADLHAVLVKALPTERVRLSSKCTGVRNVGDKAVLDFTDGTQVETDVVIGADGIHSVIRQSLFGDQPPRFTGVVCWRGLVPTSSLPPDLVSKDMTAWFGPHSTIVTYYVRGGEMVNWAAFFEQDWRQESWRIEGDKGEVLETYKDWHPAINQLVSKTERLYKWALFDREPLPQWTEGRITLLGDSAHPMLPYLAQGACMAVEDGYALALALERHPDNVTLALKEYEAERRPRTARVQLNSRARARINQLESPLSRWKRDIGYAIKKFINPAKHTYGVEWIYGHDVTENKGPERTSGLAGSR
ncbi:FAD-dependent monooxygenase [Lacisediminimonas profundi]|uniref:FAD-dependent monooxygenase n=1 Tax=Lacisediminimonas profundi TaxID=2603856 RepID=UPI00124B6CBE|nr:FAD-dependent monooxygenase [Lacisediminimonas profundi]